MPADFLQLLEEQFQGFQSYLVIYSPRLESQVCKLNVIGSSHAIVIVFKEPKVLLCHLQTGIFKLESSSNKRRTEKMKGYLLFCVKYGIWFPQTKICNFFRTFTFFSCKSERFQPHVECVKRYRHLAVVAQFIFEKKKSI